MSKRTFNIGDKLTSSYDGKQYECTAIYNTTGHNGDVDTSYEWDLVENAGGGGNELLKGLIEGTLTELVCEDATAIGKYFLYKDAYIKHVEFPNALTLGEYCFSECTALESAVFQSAVSMTGYSPFTNCKKLKKLDFHKLESFSVYSVIGCTSLETLIIRTPSMCQCSTILGQSKIASGTGYIYVPAALIDEYKADSQWSTYADQFRAIEDYPDICG